MSFLQAAAPDLSTLGLLSFFVPDAMRDIADKREKHVMLVAQS